MDIDVGHFEVAPETGSAPGRIVLWDCFGILPHFLLVVMMFCGKKKNSPIEPLIEQLIEHSVI